MLYFELDSCISQHFKFLKSDKEWLVAEDHKAMHLGCWWQNYVDKTYLSPFISISQSFYLSITHFYSLSLSLSFLKTCSTTNLTVYYSPGKVALMNSYSALAPSGEKPTLSTNRSAKNKICLLSEVLWSLQVNLSYRINTTIFLFYMYRIT